MKIGIISEFSTNTVNYGNNIQAYALCKYLQKTYPLHKTETIYFKKGKDVKVKCTFYIGFVLKKIMHIVRDMGKSHENENFLLERRVAFENFVKTNIQLCSKPMNWRLLKKSDYDLFIVGSDVVWQQSFFCVNRIKFLDFTNKSNAQKVSYAASFGRDRIPRANRKKVKRYLNNFIKISVRECSSINLLESIGVSNVVHTLDPTLLLSFEEWANLEIRPNRLPNKPFAFIYLLGMDKVQREYITHLCHKEGFIIITIPYACGIRDDVDKSFGDIQILGCAPEEWIWLIHHAELVITDSFHGTVFSTIFKKKFLVVKRQLGGGINNRMEDYLRTIHQSDKMVDLSSIDSLLGMVWDYINISSLILAKKEDSMKYLDDVIHRVEKKMCERSRKN